MLEKFDNQREKKDGKIEKAADFTGQEIVNQLKGEEGLDISNSKARITKFLIGMFLALGAMEATAQAQDWRRKATRGVETVIVNAERDSSKQYLEEFRAEEARINQLEGELYSRYREESERLRKAKDKAGLEKLNEEYQFEKRSFDLARNNNLEEYKKKMEKQRTRRQATDFLRDVIR